MQFPQPLKARTLLLMSLLMFSASASACAQPKSTRMAPGSSIKELVPDSPDHTELGICQEGSVSVTYGSLYQEGKITIQPYDLATLPALPDGYELFGGTACLITTTAVIGPPHIVRFRVTSVTDETTFGSLRIFHAEPDTFDPESPMWFDRTILPPQKPAPDFDAKTLGASSDQLGVFVIGRLMREVPTGTADLSVQCSVSADRVRAPKSVTFTCKVTNNGPQTATSVGFIDSLPPETTLVSHRATQGTCKEGAGSLYCKLGTLPVNASATVEVEVKLHEGIRSLPTEGKTFANAAWVSAKQTDNNRENDRATQLTLMLPAVP